MSTLKRNNIRKRVWRNRRNMYHSLDMLEHWRNAAQRSAMLKQQAEEELRQLDGGRR